jgi:hypothetical protein
MGHSRVIFSIVPAEGAVGWDVRRDDEDSPLKHFRAKGEAFQYGRALAEQAVKDGGRSHLKVHSDAGILEMEKTYG